MGRAAKLKLERKLNPKPVARYTLTMDEINKLVQNEVDRIIHERNLSNPDDVLKLVVDQIDAAMQCGVKSVYTALMESHVLGWMRINRDIEPIVQAINDGWMKKWEENNHDYEYSLGLLDRRFEMAQRHSTANQKRGGQS